MNKNLKVALVCDWLTEIGGGERVIRAVHEMYPDAPIYTSQYRPERATWFDSANVKTGWINALPVSLKRLIPYLRQFYFSRLDLSGYDLVISITGAEAKAVKTSPKTLHISYMHAPTQYYWTLYDQYLENPGFGFFNPVVRLGLKLLIKPLRKADYESAQRPDLIISNSTYIKNEIKKYYGRDSEIVWPNVDVETISKLAKKEPKSTKRSGFIIYGRQVSWKRMDLAIEAVIKSGEKLVVIGDGPEHERLVRLAGDNSNVEFLPRYNGIEEIVKYITSSKAYLFPSLEPFGIAPVESLAAGTPVVGLNKGGAVDFIEPGVNGVLFESQTVGSLEKAIKEFNEHSFKKVEVMKSAEKFSEKSFKESMQSIISQNLKAR